MFKQKDLEYFNCLDCSNNPDDCQAYYLIAENSNEPGYSIDIKVKSYKVPSKEFIFTYEETHEYIEEILSEVMSQVLLREHPKAEMDKGEYFLYSNDYDDALRLNREALRVLKLTHRGMPNKHYGNGVMMYCGKSKLDRAVVLLFNGDKYAVFFHPKLVNYGYKFEVVKGT